MIMENYEPGTEDAPEARAKKITDTLKDAAVYERSIHSDGTALFFMIRNGGRKKLVVLAEEKPNGLAGRPLGAGDTQGWICDLNHENAEVIRARFSFANAVPLGKTDSYGFGDRLGSAGPAHLRAVRGTGFRPVLAQQSIRELERTRRTAEEVMDAATWAVLQEGYHEGFGADGDHLKTPDDIDRMAKAGYTMFTIDPSDYVQDDVKTLNGGELGKAWEELPWDALEESPEALLDRFLKEAVPLSDGYLLEASAEEVKQGMIKYGRVITHAKKMAKHLAEAWPGHPAELELSVDETKDPTTLFEHYLVASELDRLGVHLVSLAPRFCGHFEKGIDFKGDLDQFRREYVQHLAIAGMFGGYKLSIHSGSDKFSVYEVIGSLNLGTVHVKTAGTSYLEALRTIAGADPVLFREILAFSVSRFEADKKTYHISADPARIPDPESLDTAGLKNLLDDNDARQVLHVAYGSVLSESETGAEGFKKRLTETLEKHETLHEDNLLRHFKKHLQPFG